MKFISLLPLSVLYFFSDILHFFLYKVFKYRKKVVLSNLKNSFPQMSDQEINTLAKKFYVHLSDMMVESIKAFTISEKQLKKRFVIENLEFVTERHDRNENLIAVTGHYGNWEWLGLSGSLQIEPQLYSLFRKLKNKTLNDLVVKNRQRFGLGLIAEREAQKKVEPILEQKDWAAVVFIADQAVKPEKAYWIDFLNQKTTFVKGPERYAKLTNCPIVFLNTKKIKRGYYSLEVEMFLENYSDFEEGEIMKLFAKRLEQQIIEEPAYWVWSHKRWKYHFPGADTKSSSI